MSEKEWMEKLRKEGFGELRVCPLPPATDSGEHTHDRHTVHVILSGELIISDKRGTETYRPGDRVEFSAGTAHKAKSSGGGEMIIGVKEGNLTFKSQHISVSINCSAEEVYEFASNPENLPKWATGLGSSVKSANGEWIAESPMGKIGIKFAEKNEFGILDHDVTLPSGEVFYNPMRVFPNGEGSELVFTLYQRPGMSDEMLAEDAKTVRKDLERLKSLLEKTED